MTSVVPVRDAATVMLLRDTEDGIEVFMLRRTLRAEFVGGAYVFPGGAVDEADRHADLESVCDGLDDVDASAALGVDGGGLAYWVAAVRECFEEAGVLLALDASGGLVRLDEPELAARFTGHRHAVYAHERRLVNVCAQEGLRLAVGGMKYWSHWITPEGAPRRYDTRFFVAVAPSAQEPLHDDREAIANLWIRPQDALDRYERGDFEMIIPTIKNLESIARYDRAADAIAAAGAGPDTVAVQPRALVGEDGEVRIVLPGEPGYDLARAVPE